MKKVKLLLLLITLTSTGVLAQQQIAAHITTESRDTPQRNNEPPRMNTADRNKIIKPYKGQTIYNINKKTYETFNGSKWYESKHFLGEEFGGGVIYSLRDNGQHGSIISKADLHCAIQWNNGVDKVIGTLQEGNESGAKKTELIVAAQSGDNPNGIFAAKLCADYTVKQNGQNYSDWHLPSQLEFYRIHEGKNYINGLTDNYWTSNESSQGNSVVINSAFTYSFIIGDIVSHSRSELKPVRAIRFF